MALLQQAVEFQRSGRLPEAEARYQQVLLVSPDLPAPDLAGVHYNLGNVLRDQDRPEEAISSYRRALEVQPRSVPTIGNLASALAQTGRLDEAAAVYRDALRFAPGDAVLHFNLGNVLSEQGKLRAAVASYRSALQVRPDWADVHFNLGNALRGLGNLDEAIAAHRQALAHNANDPQLHFGLGVALSEQDRMEEAAACYRAALLLKQDWVPALQNLGNMLRGLGELDEALACYRRVLARQPDYLGAWSGLAATLADQGKPDEAHAALRSALSVRPDSAKAYSELLASASYQSLIAPPEYLALARGWERAVIGDAERNEARRRVFRAAPLTGRRLRLGYVSGDFRQHAVSFFMEQIFRHHDRARIELFAYSTHGWTDAVTARLQSHADHWLQVENMSDAAVRERVGADRIDVLVDLSGHTAFNRMGVFALRAAPVQVEYLGGLGSSGLTEMDYWLGDAIVTPPETDAHFQEQVWRLPRSWVSYEGGSDAPEPRRRAAPDGTVWLGSFTDLKKLTPATFALWARALLALPEGKLLLKTKMLADAGNRQRVLDALAAHGVASGRIELQDSRATPSWSSHMDYYGRLDLALDPVGVHTGATTTCDALWMGVPVITRLGDRMGSRMTAASLNALGHAEWAARSDDEFVEKAVALARDADRRAQLRHGLRGEMARSPLCDARGLARCLEDAYAGMYERWLAGQSGRNS